MPKSGKSDGEFSVKPINTIHERREPDGCACEDELPPSGDFRNEIDLSHGMICSCDTGEVEFCPLCDHPDLKKGEYCICNAPVEYFDKAKFKKKRKATAYNEDGQPLSSKYCAIIIPLSEARRILVKAKLPVEFFDH